MLTIAALLLFSTRMNQIDRRTNEQHPNYNHGNYIVIEIGDWFTSELPIGPPEYAIGCTANVASDAW